MKWIVQLVAGLALAACTASVPGGNGPAPANNIAAAEAGPTAGSREAAAADATMNFEMNSWGKPIVSWRIGPDGEGIHVTYPAASGPPAQTAVVKRFSAGADGYRRIRELMAVAEGYRRPVVPGPYPYEGGGPPCDEQATDHPYGKVEWSGPNGNERVRVDLGCKSAAAHAFHRNLAAADELISSWAQRSPAQNVPARPATVRRTIRWRRGASGRAAAK